MQQQFTAPTVYFLQEGHENLRECLKVVFQAVKQQNIRKIVIFTARGEGVRIALEDYCCQPDFDSVKIVAVTFPSGKSFTDANNQPIAVEIPQETLKLFEERLVPVVRAHMPFDPISPLYRQRGVLGQDLSLVGEALNMFCGSMGLCVQATVMACDAGAVELGEHVIALTSDTAIVAQATSTRRMLEELVIREILCKPAVLSIGRKEVAEKLPKQLDLGIVQDSKKLPASEPTEDKK